MILIFILFIQIFYLLFNYVLRLLVRGTVCSVWL